MALACQCPLWYMVRMAPRSLVRVDIPPDVIRGHQEDLARLGQGVGLLQLAVVGFRPQGQDPGGVGILPQKFGHPLVLFGVPVVVLGPGEDDHHPVTPPPGRPAGRGWGR